MKQSGDVSARGFAGICLFTESVFPLDLSSALAMARKAGYQAVELACKAPHLNLETARGLRPRNASIDGLGIAALSLYTNFTDPERREADLRSSREFIRLAEEWGIGLIKITPGGPSSRQASEEHYEECAVALLDCASTAARTGIRLAVETHMRMLTDTIEGTERLLSRLSSSLVGVTLDACNLAIAGDDPVTAVQRFGDRVIHVHVKDFTSRDGSPGCSFTLMGEGRVDHPAVLAALRGKDYRGWLSVECLGEDAKRSPLDTITHDLLKLRNWAGSS